jgi:hypothetical protein
MPDPVSEIIERFFARAGADPAAAPLAHGFAAAYREGQWTADRLDRTVQAFVEANNDRCDPAPPGRPAG